MTTEAGSHRRFIGSPLRFLFWGAIVAVFSLNGLMRMIAHHWPESSVSPVLLKTASIPESLYQAIPGGPNLIFELLLRWVLISLALYLLLILIVSLRHTSFTVLFSGALGLVIGLFSLTWLSLLIFAVGLLYFILSWIFGVVKLIVDAIVSFLLWGPVFYTILGAVALLVVFGVVSVLRGISFRELWRSIKELLSNLPANPVVIVIGSLTIIGLIWFFGIPFWQQYIAPILAAFREWIALYIGPIVSWIVAMIFTLIAAALVIALTLGSVGVIGWQFAEQFLSARACGQNTHKLFEAGFSIGVVFGVVLLVCLANPNFQLLVNTTWADTAPVLVNMNLTTAVYGLMPQGAETLLKSAFSKASLPIFDLAALLLTLLAANCSLATAVVSGVTIEPLRKLIQVAHLPPMGKLLFGLFLALGTAYVSQDE